MSLYNSPVAFSMALFSIHATVNPVFRGNVHLPFYK